MSSEQDTLEMLTGIGRGIGSKAVLFPTSDKTAVFTADHAEELREFFLFPEPGRELVRSLCSKQSMYDLARRHQVDTPETIFPRNREEVITFLQGAKFPIVMKPIFGALPGRVIPPVVRVESREDLLKRYDETEDPTSPNLMLQEFVPGGDDQTWVFNGYFDENGACRFGLTGRKIRNYPPEFGAASSGICILNHDVREITIRFMRELNYRGCLDIGYRLDPRDGKYKVHDINPRIGAMFRCFVDKTDMDVARVLYRDVTGEAVGQAVPYERRVWVVENNDFYSFLYYLRKGKISIREWCRSIRRVDERTYLILDDLLPALGAAIEDLRVLLSPVTRELRRVRASCLRMLGRHAA